MPNQQQQQQQQQQNNNTNVQKQQNSSTKLNNSNNLATTPNGTVPSLAAARKQNNRDKEKERSEREQLVLWRHPILTLTYCFYELMIFVQDIRKKYFTKPFYIIEVSYRIHIFIHRLIENKYLIAVVFVLIGVLSAFYHVPGEHQMYYGVIRKNLWFCVYWLGLGVLSSVGLGTGLHTFLLYLGPHIASVTLAAYECNSLNFPEPPYPDE